MRGNVWAQFSKSAPCGDTESVGTSVTPPARRSVIFHFQKVFFFFFYVVLLLLLLFCQLEAYTKKDYFFRCLKATGCSIEHRRKENNISILPLTPTAGKLYKLHLHGQKSNTKGGNGGLAEECSAFISTPSASEATAQRAANSNHSQLLLHVVTSLTPPRCSSPSPASAPPPSPLINATDTAGEPIGPETRGRLLELHAGVILSLPQNTVGHLGFDCTVNN